MDWGKSIGSRHNIIPGEICVKIKEFVERFDTVGIHYSNSITKKNKKKILAFYT